MSAPKKILYISNSQFLELVGLKDQSVTPNVYMNAATVVGTLKDPNGVNVVGFVNVVGVYQTASNGTYRLAADPTTFNPPLGGGYTLVVTATQAGKQLYVEYPVKIQTRQTGTEV